MKTKQLIAATLFCALFTFFNHAWAQMAYSNGEYLTGVINERWGASSTWENNSRVSITYSTPTTAAITAEQWNGFSWDLVQKGTVTLTPNYAFSNITWQKWDGTQAAWRNKGRTNYTYFNNDPTKILVYKSDTANAVNNAIWDDSYRQTYTYNPNGLQLQELNENKNGNAWQANSRNVYTYNASSLPISRQSQWWQTTGNYWSAGNKSVYFYNTNSLVSLLIDSTTTSPSSTLFKPNGKIQYFYNANNLAVQELQSSFNTTTNTWNTTPYARSLSTYNAQNLRIQRTTEVDYAQTGNFTLSSTQSYTYNSAGNYLSSTTISATEPTSSYRSLHTYGQFVNTENTTPAFDFSVFPNPTAEQINLTLPENGGVEIGRAHV